MRQFVVASEEAPSMEAGAKYIRIERGVRLFRLTEDIVAQALAGWSDPVRLRLSVRSDGTYDLWAERA